MKSYTVKQLFENGIISKRLKSVLVILECNNSEDLVALSEDNIKVSYIERSFGLKEELLKAVSDVQTLDIVIPSSESKIEPFNNRPFTQNVRKGKKNFKVGDYTEELLQISKEPIKLEVLVNKIKEFLPDTYIESIRANLNGDPQKRFVLFLDGYVGLKEVKYDKRYHIYSVTNKKRQYAEQRILEFMTFVEEKHRSPQPHGLEEEESLYRWYLDFTKSKAKETEDLRTTFSLFLKEYDKWIYTPYEYSYKKNCDQIKWYVEENLELPSSDDEPELASWFYFQLEYHIKHQDKRKQMFMDLLEYLKIYGMHFYNAKSEEGKAALLTNSKYKGINVSKESEENKFYRILSFANNELDKYAVHKSLLLITILDLVETGVIKSNYIILNDELLTHFADVCIENIGTASSYNIAFPFFYLNEESFWELIPAEGKNYEDILQIKSPTYDIIESSVSYAIIDENLFELIRNQETSQNIRNCLVNNLHFNESNQYNLRYEKQYSSEESIFLAREEFIKYIDGMNMASLENRKAPHKPILLLSIIELVQQGKILTNHIELTDELNNKFKEMWQEYIDDENDAKLLVAEDFIIEEDIQNPFRCNIASPFYYLQSEPFWSLQKSENYVRKLSYGVKALRENFDYAVLDEQYFKLMQDKASASVIKSHILNML